MQTRSGHPTLKELLHGREFDFAKGYSIRSSAGKELVRAGEQTELGLSRTSTRRLEECILYRDKTR